MKKILGILATGCLALGAANTASAIPLDINIQSSGLGAGGGWDLSGPSDHSGLWGVAFGSNNQWWNYDIDPGHYSWTILGAGGFAAVNWSLFLDGALIHSGADGGLAFVVYDNKHFDVVSAVPEPGTLGLLGLALVGIGFATTRRRQERSSNLAV